MAQKVIDLSGIGGLTDRYYGDLPYSSSVSSKYEQLLGADNQYAEGFVNPISHVGQLSPVSNTFVTITPSPTAMICATIIDTVNLKPYFLDQGEHLYATADLTSNGAVATTIITSQIDGATGTDLEIYTVNGIRRLFYSYRKSGGGNIGIYDFTYPYDIGLDADWLSTAVSGTTYLGATNNHRMIVADNGYMYVLDGSTLHKIDGTTGGGANGTLTANVLLFPAIFQLVDAIDLRGKMWIGLIRSTDDLSTISNSYNFEDYCGVYVWDRSTTGTNFEDFIPISGVKELWTTH